MNEIENFKAEFVVAYRSKTDEVLNQLQEKMMMSSAVLIAGRGEHCFEEFHVASCLTEMKLCFFHVASTAIAQKAETMQTVI